MFRPLLLFILLAATLLPQRPPAPAVQTGIERLIAGGFKPLQGKRVGLVTNPTGVTHDLRATVDVLAHAPGVKLVALFGPEHGVRGDARAGESVQSSHDPATGLPVYSLYGSTRKPTAAMLSGVDVLVFDIQDIGSRSYTYIATMGDAMASAAEHHIPFLVLDRPNPIGGDRVEGNVLDTRFKSGVGPYPIAYCHGLTVAELAQMINAKGWLSGGAKCELTIEKMSGWRRDMTWEETGLPWVPTSPHIPKPETSYFYAATGIVGELPGLSIGVGYTLPFELAGRPGIEPRALAAELEHRRLPGFAFRPMSWRPFYQLFQGEACGGVQIYLTDARKAPLTRLNFEIIEAFRKLAPGARLLGGKEDRMFDLVCGTNEVRRMFQSGRSSAEVWARWNSTAADFRRESDPYRLYR